MGKLTNMQIAEICRRYQAGERAPVLAKTFGITNEAVHGFLKRRHIERQDISACHRWYSCNHAFFTSIDTEEKAYWLGFLAADAYISREKRGFGTINISVQLQDKEHLSRFLTALSSTHPVREYRYASAEHPEKRDFARVRISSGQMVRDLEPFGIVQGKSLTVPWPHLSEDLLVHYLRGYFDGNGGFSFSTRRETATFEVTSNLFMLEPCQQFLMQKCNLAQTKMYQRHEETPIFTLRYSGRLQVMRIADLLYANATIYLPRKREVLQRIIPR